MFRTEGSLLQPVFSDVMFMRYVTTSIRQHQYKQSALPTRIEVVNKCFITKALS